MYQFLLQFPTTQMKNKRKRQQFNLNQGINFNFIKAAFLEFLHIVTVMFGII
jgi:hypothetical protein